MGQVKYETSYDRDLIAEMLDGLANDTCAWSLEAIREQAALLRQADNLDAAGVHTACLNRGPADQFLIDTEETIVDLVAYLRGCDTPTSNVMANAVVRVFNRTKALIEAHVVSTPVEATEFVPNKASDFRSELVAEILGTKLYALILK